MMHRRKLTTLAVAGALALACGPSTDTEHEDTEHHESPRTTDRDCYEDEVIMWTGEDHDMCIPIDTLAAVVELDKCREINPDVEDRYECKVLHLDQINSHLERRIE